MAVPGIGAVGGLANLPDLSGLGRPSGIPSVTDLGETSGATGLGGASFGDKLLQGLQQVQDLQAQTDDLAVKAATGDVKDVHDLMVKATEANLALDLTVAVRNKALEAFHEIMRMQI